ncbi:MAG: 4Fe-4S binding protein [Anaerolineales bacterium]|nr:4Fe-4S binding protein [Anaerolineales bacterium]
MAKDLYDKLCSSYEFMLGPLPWEDEFKIALQEMVTSEDLEVFFRLPMVGAISWSKLVKKAGMTEESLSAALDRLSSQGMLMVYTKDGQKKYERGNPVYMTEQQVRKKEDTPRRRFYARFFNAIITGELAIEAPNKTPYFRVLPQEATLKGKHTEGTGKRIPVNEDIPDPRAILPTDIVSEMVRRDARLIAVADCYCRLTKQIVGEGCDNPIETCLSFNELAESLIAVGNAREISLEEALEIIRLSADHNLIHNVDNCAGEINCICNCCSCCCSSISTFQRGMKSGNAPSHYRVVYDQEKCDLCLACVEVCPTETRSFVDGRIVTDENLCLGCGLCVNNCPEGAIRMVQREERHELHATRDELYAKIGKEAIVGLAKQKVVGLFKH